MRTLKMALVGVSSAALLVTGGTMAAGAAPRGGEAQVSAPGAKAVAPKGASAKGVDTKAAWSCTRGAICFYTGKNGTGTRHQRFANTDKNITGINSMWNNGFTNERLDHVKVKWNWSGESTSHWGCFSPNESWSGASVTVDAVRWVDSC